MTETRSGPLSPAKKILFTGAMLVIVLGALELAGWLYMRSTVPFSLSEQIRSYYQYHPIQKRQLPANIVYHPSRRIETDAFGYLKVAERISDPAATVAVVGSSLIAGTIGVAIEDMAPSILQELLNNGGGPRVDVVNLAMPGSTSFEELMILYQYFTLNQRRADIVIAANSITDGINGCRFKKSPYDLYDKKKQEFVIAAEQGGVGPVAMTMENFLNRNIHAVRAVKTMMEDPIAVRLPTSALEDRDLPNLGPSAIGRQSRMNYRLMKGLSESFGARLIVATLPVIYGWQHVEDVTLHEGDFREIHEKACGPFIRTMQAAVLADPAPYRTLDLWTVFDDMPPGKHTTPYLTPKGHYGDHYTPRGNRRVAEHIADRVSDMLSPEAVTE